MSKINYETFNNYMDEIIECIKVNKVLDVDRDNVPYYKLSKFLYSHFSSFAKRCKGKHNLNFSYGDIEDYAIRVGGDHKCVIINNKRIILSIGANPIHYDE